MNSKYNEITDYINNFKNNSYSIIKNITEISLKINEFENNRHNYVEESNHTKEDIIQFFKSQLNDLLYFLEKNIDEVSFNSYQKYNEFCNELLQNCEKKLISYRDYIKSSIYNHYTKIQNLRDFISLIEVESENANSYDNIGFFSYIIFLVPTKQMINIIKYLTKKTNNKINDILKEFKRINENYPQQFKNEIERLFKESEKFVEKENEKSDIEYNKEMEEYKRKLSEWEDIQKEYKEIVKEINNI